MGRSFGRPIRVDETILKKQAGFYANILVEIDLAKVIPNKVGMESKYGKFEQEIRFSNLPKFCNHCQGQNQNSVGFDICFPSNSNAGTSGHKEGAITDLIPICQNDTSNIKSTGSYFSKAVAKPIKGKKVVPNVTTRKQANNSVKFKPNVRAFSSILKQLRLTGISRMVIHNSYGKLKGNIWVFWNSSLSIPSIISSTRQALTTQVAEAVVTGVHAACLTIDRRELWSPLRITMQEFRDCIESCNSMQAPRSGIKYLWCNNKVGRKRILCDLDKAFYNVKWLEQYEGWNYKVGVRGTSDHGALMGGVTNITRPSNIPFRYQAVWTTHPDFIKVIQDSWNGEVFGNPTFCFISKLKRLKNWIWNWEVFGDLSEKVKSTEDNVMDASLESDADPENMSC
ncbi:uncharacterized protein LOC113294750 [Papaver somniferum]|uniref:uncharacterized protein LOC113294750 n=1 Tax=Papaver somniferum TaxID=3469 RepID=UPI000E7039A8|nr:uncharacterized protein LOC113294750 [Papaver somniferum]